MIRTAVGAPTLDEIYEAIRFVNAETQSRGLLPDVILIPHKALPEFRQRCPDFFPPPGGTLAPTAMAVWTYTSKVDRNQAVWEAEQRGLRVLELTMEGEA